MTYVLNTFLEDAEFARIVQQSWPTHSEKDDRSAFAVILRHGKYEDGNLSWDLASPSPLPRVLAVRQKGNP